MQGEREEKYKNYRKPIFFIDFILFFKFFVLLQHYENRITPKIS